MPSTSIKAAVSAVNNPEADYGGYFLPNIQRNFVWSEEQIERLFDSIMRGYPISSFLFWVTKDEIKARRFAESYTPPGSRPEYLPVDTKKKVLVLDGQQRLQALYLALKGQHAGREFYFDVTSGDQVGDDDVRYRFGFYKRDEVPGPQWIRMHEIVFSGDAYTLTETVRARVGREPQRIGMNISKVKHFFVDKERITYDRVDSVDGDEKYTYDDILEIFIRANSGGTPLGKSELLFSLMKRKLDDIEERLDDLLDGLNKGDEYRFNRDFVLKCCLVLTGSGARYGVEKFRNEAAVAKINNEWERIAASIAWVRDFIRSRTFVRSHETLTSQNALIPLIYTVYRSRELRLPPEAEGNARVWLLLSLLNRSFGGSTDTLLDSCVKLIDTSGFDRRALDDMMARSGRRTGLNRTMLDKCGYRDPSIYLVLNLVYPNVDFVPAFEGNDPELDHIFPQARLKKYSQPGSRKQLYPREVIDCLANMRLVERDENRRKSGTPAEEFLATLPDEKLDLHVIPRDRDLWKEERFPLFIAERQRLLIERIEKRVGLAVSAAGSGQAREEARCPRCGSTAEQIPVKLADGREELRCTECRTR